MIKKISKVFLALLFSFISIFQVETLIAQTNSSSFEPDTRLYEAFGKEYVDFLKQNNPQLIGYFNFFLDNSFVLVQHPSEKIPGIISSCPMLELNNPALAIDHPDMVKGTKSINIFKYKYKIEQDKIVQYRLDDSGIIIIFYSGNTITEMYNKSRKI